MNPGQLFQMCLDDVINKRVGAMNSNVFRTQGNLSMAPAGFVQKVPDQAYLNRARHSVFQKIDLSEMDFSKIPYHPKP